MSDSRVVVVGGGIASLRVVQELRASGSAAKVTVLAGEAHQPYDRPPLSKGVLRGDGRDPTLPMDWAGVDLRLGVRAQALDPERRTVRLEDGSEIPYDAAVIATGARPRTIASLSGPGTHVLRTLDDSHHLADDIRRTGTVTVIGGGFIGSEVAASAHAMGADVTLVEALPTPLAAVLGTELGAEMAALHESHGVTVLAGTTVLEARGTGPDRQLVLSDGRTLAAPVVVVGIGITPDTDWLVGSGLTVEDGVVCDATGRTSLDGVWAAGDVARWWHPLYSSSLRQEHWTSAAEQGGTVGRDLGGRPEPLASVPYFWSDQHGVKLQLLGRPEPGDEVTVLRVGPQSRLVAVYGRAGLATAVLGMGAARWVMRARPLLHEGASAAAVLTAMTE